MPIIMSDLKKRSTLISEVARRRLSISRDDYALNQYIHYRCADPRQKVAGWCCDAKEEIAEFVGVTRPGLYQMMKRNEAAGLLEFGILGAVRATAKWVDCENDCKQSLHEDVNKVYTDCKQSLHTTVNKVYTQYNVKEDISKSKGEGKEEAKKAGNPLCPPFQKIAEIELPENFSLAANPSQPTSPGGGGPGAILVSITGPEHPEITVHDIIEPQTEPVKTGRSKTKNPRTNEPQIHPENEQAFQHFNDPAKARAAWAQWIKYKFEQFRDKYKSGDSELICLRKHWKDTNGDAAAFEKNISHSIGSLYKGIFPPKEEKTHGTNGQPNGLNAATRQHLNLAKGTYERWQRAFSGDDQPMDYITGAK